MASQEKFEHQVVINGWPPSTSDHLAPLRPKCHLLQSCAEHRWAEGTKSHNIVQRSQKEDGGGWKEQSEVSLGCHTQLHGGQG